MKTRYSWEAHLRNSNPTLLDQIANNEYDEDIYAFHIGDTNCELCGHDIKNIFVIRNKKTQETHNVGSDCIQEFSQVLYNNACALLDFYKNVKDDTTTKDIVYINGLIRSNSNLVLELSIWEKKFWQSISQKWNEYNSYCQKSKEQKCLKTNLRYERKFISNMLSQKQRDTLNKIKMKLYLSF